MFVDQAQEQIRHPLRFRANLSHIRPRRDLDSDLERGHRQNRRGAAEMPLDSRRRAVVRVESERGLVTHPSGERGTDSFLVPLRHVEKSGRARAPVQVLVAAADGEVDVVSVEVERNGAGAMAQVPEDEGAPTVSEPGEPRHVVHLARSEIDMRERHDRDAVVDGALEPCPGHHGKAATPEKPGEPLGDVEVRRKVLLLREDYVSISTEAHRRPQELEEVDRRRVRGNHLSWRRARDLRDAVPHAPRVADPVVCVPAPDQVPAPLFGNDLLEPRCRLFREGPERVPIQVEDSLGNVELVSKRSERIRLVPGGYLAPGELRH
jgi:hypothetical protein